MSDAELWEEMRGQSRDKKMHNLSMSTAILLKARVKFVKLSPWHYRIGEYDLWPTTGKFVHRPKGVWGRGVFNLIKLIK